MGDLNSMQSAKLSEVDNRTLKVPQTDTQVGANLDIPIDSVRAGKFLAFDGVGKPIVAAGTSADLTPVSTFIDTLLDDADAATARATLDAQEEVITTRGDLVVGNSTPAASRLALGTKNFAPVSNGTDLVYGGGVETKTADVTVALTDFGKTFLVDATSGNITITLTAAATLGANFRVSIVRTDTSTNTVTIDLNGSETIIGAGSGARTTVTLVGQGDHINLVCDGSDFFAMAFRATFTSADQTITTTGQLVLAHGLGVEPRNVELILECQTAELNHSVGDRALVDLSTRDGSATRGQSVVIDSTNITIRYASAASVFALVDRTTGGLSAVTNANWKLIVRACA